MMNMNLDELKATTNALLSTISEEDSHVVLLKNELKLTPKAIAEMEVEVGNKVWLAFTSETEPVLVINSDSGNTLKVARTVACSGKYNLLLRELGTKFNIEKVEDNVFALFPYVEAAEDICD